MVKDEGGRFEKLLNIRIHYYHSLVFKKYFFEKHVHTLTELPFYTGPKDAADPVEYNMQENKRKLLKSSFDPLCSIIPFS